MGASILVVGAVAATGTSTTRESAVAGYQAAYLTGAIVIVAGAVLEAFLYRRRTSSQVMPLA